MFVNPYIFGPAAGAFFGYLMGCLMNHRAILSTANWIPGYVILGALAGLNGAAVLSGTKNGKKEDWKKEVWDKVIVPDREFLYKEPGYSFDED